jgi:hypothetical protein
MCYFVASQHNCGHLHESFARCFFAQRDGSHACNQQSFPIWQHPDPFPCPDCRAHRKAETQELVSNKGRKMSDTTHMKTGTHQRASSHASSSHQPAEQIPQPPLDQQFAGEYAIIEAQLQTLAARALHMSPAPEEQFTWVPPSRRHVSVVGQLGSSPPVQVQGYGFASPHSPETESSPTDSLMMPSYPHQVQSASPSLAWLLRQTES